MEPLAELVAAKHAAAAELLSRTALIGVGVGTRVREGRATGEPCVRLYVEHKQPLGELAREAILPVAVGGFRTDVVETGRFSAGPARLPPRTRQRVPPVERNRVDAALALMHNRYNVDGSILPRARLLRLPHAPAAAGQRVHKSGRSTGHTRGVVMDASVDLKVFYRSGILRFEEQLLIEGA